MIIRDNKGNRAEVHMYAPCYDQYAGWDRGEDIINDWFDASVDDLFVADVDYCIDFMKALVDADGEDAKNSYREVVINGEIYSNWR